MPKKVSSSNYWIIALILHISKVILKILQVRLQQYMNWELSDVQARFRKGRGTRDQTTSIYWIMEKAKEFQKSIYLLYWLYENPWLCGSHKLWEILKEMGIADHLTCLLSNLWIKKQVRTLHGTTNWFPVGKGVHQGYILSPCLFNFYIRNAGLDESQAGIKTSRRNINNLIYAYDTTLMAESEEELKSLLMKVKKLA